MLIVDDYGRCELDIMILRIDLFKRKLDQWTDERVRGALIECSEAFNDEGVPLVTLYQVGHKRFLQLNNFGQRARYQSKFPGPEGGSPVSLVYVGPSPKQSDLVKLSPAKSVEVRRSPSEPDCAVNEINSLQEKSDLDGPSQTKTATRARTHSHTHLTTPTHSEGEKLVLDETWPKFLEAAVECGLSQSSYDLADAYYKWGMLDFSQKLAAIAGLRSRKECGEFSDPAWIPLPQNYIEKRTWLRPLRDKRMKAQQNGTYTDAQVNALYPEFKGRGPKPSDEQEKNS
jgi:hypothetical protein